MQNPAQLREEVGGACWHGLLLNGCRLSFAFDRSPRDKRLTLPASTMAGKKAAKRAVPNVSSAAGLPPSSSASKVGTSAVLHSAFSPSPLQLSLFASVIQSLDSDQLRIHDTVSGALQCEHRPQRTKITCLDWGYRGRPYGDPETSRKKRRKLDQVNGASSSHGDAVIGLGTSRSEVEVFSPAESKVIATLKDGHTRGILNFKFEDLGRSSKAWTLGGDGKLVQWDVWRRSIIRCVPRLHKD